jgi:hypothetical protein
MLFRLSTVTAARLKDERGRDIPTVLAAPLDEGGRQAMAVEGRRDEDRLLRFVETHPDDPPPLKWSDLRYVFDIKEDCNGKEAIQA